jgi:hypothetical protein
MTNKPSYVRAPGAPRMSPLEINRNKTNAQRGTTAQRLSPGSTGTTVIIAGSGGGSGSGGGGVTYSARAPLQLSGGTFMIAPAGSGTDGYLVADDWAAFDAKEPGLGNPPANGYVLSSLMDGTRSWIAPGGGGGGSSAYTLPLLSAFTVVNAPAGSTAADTSTGLTMYTASTGLTMNVLADNTGPGSTFTITTGFKTTALLNNAGLGIFVADATGKYVTWGIDMAGASAGNINYWTNANTWTTNPMNAQGFIPAEFLKLVYDGTNFYFYSGTDLNALLLLQTLSATAFIGTPVSVGLYEFGYTQQIIGTFFHYLHTV